ncbi:MAG: tRNA pseudouridine(13) synthase TruD [Deltaproteobacteria bacterium]|nr:tRNA pseudouridine(13) synthase TruD [Deltaproteobacteria bacterium]
MRFDPLALPLLTAELPGVGGATRDPEDFVVEELPAYLPCGEGEHTLVRIEKRGLTTPQAIDRLARAVGVSPATVGYAGMKDRHAVTRQWLSFSGVDPAALLAVEGPELRVLEAGRHKNKLRTGHLQGNRFVLVLRGVREGDAVAGARAILARLTESGVPNYYGAQRFGSAGDNAERALAMLRGEEKLPRDRHQHRLLVSSLQSFLFNAVLAERIGQGLLANLLGGEVLQRTDSGGLFVSEERETDQARLERGELVITGPMCGPRMPRPKEGSAAREAEDRVLDAHRVGPDDFARFGRLARGGRRPLAVPLGEPELETVVDDPSALRLRFALPAGAYATVVLRELCK